MGRRLSSWERSQRESERQSRAAGRRALTAKRRSQERAIRERQQSEEKRAKAAQTASEIAQNRSIVSKFENYIHNLESLHNKHDLNKFEKDYEYRLRKRAYKPGTIKEVTPFKKESFKIKSSKKKTYKAKKFSMATYEKSDFKKEKENGNLIFPNSGIKPDEELWLETGAVIELNIKTKSFVSYGINNNIIDGFWGINYQDSNSIMLSG